MFPIEMPIPDSMRALPTGDPAWSETVPRLMWQNRAMLRMVATARELSSARDLAAVRSIVPRAARAMTGADGATLILREEHHCHYVDEDAMSPLWKGERVPMSACIAGWVMLNRQPTAIEDVYHDARIASEAYTATFVKSLVMVPIRRDEPMGAIGSYWADGHHATDFEVDLLQTLADIAAAAMENIGLHADLDERLRARTHELDVARHELDAIRRLCATT